MENPQHAQIFVQSVESLFAEMFNIPVSNADAQIKAADEPWLDITGTIGMTGSLSGAMALTFDRLAAEGVAAELLGKSIDFDSEDIADAVGELANIVAGKAKSMLNTDGTMSITCPTVTRGSCITHLNPGCDVISIEFDCLLGRIRLEFSLKAMSTDTDTRHAAA